MIGEKLDKLKKLIKCASNHEKASLVIKNITIIDVFQNDRFVATKSEGEEPNRRVVIYLKK